MFRYLAAGGSPESSSVSNSACFASSTFSYVAGGIGCIAMSGRNDKIRNAPNGRPLAHTTRRNNAYSKAVNSNAKPIINGTDKFAALPGSFASVQSKTMRAMTQNSRRLVANQVEIDGFVQVDHFVM